VGPDRRAPDSPVGLQTDARGTARALTWADLARQVARLRGAIGALSWQRPLVVCNDRFHMAATLLACWAEGRVAVLPSGTRPAALRALLDTGAADGLFHDGAATEGTDVTQLATALDPTLDRAVAEIVALLERRDRQRLVTVFSSGSTGDPLAAHKTAGQLLGEAQALAEAFGLGGRARLLATAPAHHIYGLLFSVMVPLVGGGAFVRDTPLHAESIAARVEALAVNVFCSVPPHLHGLAVLPASALRGLERVFCSGAPLAPQDATLLSGRFGLDVTEVLGSTETGGIAWRLAVGQGDWTPLPGVRVTADADGVLLLDSSFLDPDLARPMRGADRIALGEEGRFRHLGRADTILKVGGERVSLVEIERRLLATEGVLDAAVLAIADPGPRGHEICAAVVAPGLTAPELRRRLLAWFAPVALPRRLKLMERLPREETGKLRREALAGLFEEGEVAGT
jgi:acyl-coenzyme A synthetase/AMP-(fatty) acid ligase